LGKTRLAGLKLEMPHWCGADVAGEVAQVGEGVAGWIPGQKCGGPWVSTTEDEFTRRGEASVSPGYHILGEQVRGGAAEYLAVPASNLLQMPDGWDFADAAARSWSALRHGACSSIGPGSGSESLCSSWVQGRRQLYGIQIAKLAGARVYVVCGTGRKRIAPRSSGLTGGGSERGIG